MGYVNKGWRILLKNLKSRKTFVKFHDSRSLVFSFVVMYVSIFFKKLSWRLDIILYRAKIVSIEGPFITP